MGNIISEEFKNIKNMKDIPDDYFVPGRKVKVIGNEKYVKKVQERRHGWNDSMKECLNRVYEVKCIDADKGIKLLTSKEWIFDRASLESIGDEYVSSKYSSPSSPCSRIQSQAVGNTEPDIPLDLRSDPDFKVGEFIRLDSNEDNFIILQRKFGGYSKHTMQRILGEIAEIIHISDFGILVQCKGEFTINPELLHKVASESENQLPSATVITKMDACIPPEPVPSESEDPSLPATVTLDASITPEPGLSKVISAEEIPVISQEGLQRFFQEIKKGNIEYVLKSVTTELLTMKGPHGRTPINMACCYGQKNIVEFLIGFGDKMNIFDDKGKLPVHNCLLFDHPHVLELILGKNTNAIQALTADGKTLLHLAVIGNQQDMIKLLTEANINKYIMDDDGKMASYYSRDSVNAKITKSEETVPENQIECGICFDRAKNTYFKDCGHTACNVCADQLIVCHLCKKRILQRQKYS